MDILWGCSKMSIINLTTFHFKGFKGLKDDLKLVRYILERAKILIDDDSLFLSSRFRGESLCSQWIIDVPKAVYNL